MRLKRLYLLLITLLGMSFSGSFLFSQEQAGVSLAITDIIQIEAVQGEMLSILIRTANNAQPPRLTITDSQGTYIAGCYGFSVPGPPGLAVYQLLAGIPVLQEPGDYNMLIKYQSGDDVIERRGVLTVNQGPYPEETIYLNAATTEMMLTPDPRKKEQSERLSKVILSFENDHFYHSGALIAPIDPNTGRESSIFGAIRTFKYSTGKTTHSYHRGHDWAAPKGTPVRAPGSGIVRLAEYRIVTGNTVVIEHLPGVFSMLFHMDSLSVTEGQAISQGELIGELGSTGLSTGPHVHWELRIHGVPVNPKKYLDRGLLDKSFILSKIHKYIF